MSEQLFFPYGDTEIQWLQSRDPILGAAIERIGHIERPLMPNMFSALLHTIVGQQISTKAHLTVWLRMQERFAPLTPEHLGTVTAEELQTCGISLRKATYIKDIAYAVLNGDVRLEELSFLSDEEVCDRLIRFKGIGTWTAEMLMIFTLQRPNILSYNDLGIHRGLRMLYHHRRVTPELFEKYRRRYAPYATVASLYLWAIAGGACPEMKDYAPQASKAKKKPAS